MGLRSWRWWKAKLGDDALPPIVVDGAPLVAVPEGAVRPLMEADETGITPLPHGGKTLEGL